jgi:hypothetical protein
MWRRSISFSRCVERAGDQPIQLGSLLSDPFVNVISFMRREIGCEQPTITLDVFAVACDKGIVKNCHRLGPLRRLPTGSF